MNTKEYLTAEIRRYFPDTSVEVQIDHQEELITAIIANKPWIMDINSDDDWYVFTSYETEHSFTVPLPPSPTEFDKLTPAQQDFILDNLEEDIRDNPYTYAEEIARGYAIKLDAQGIKDYLEAFADMEASGNDDGDKE